MTFGTQAQRQYRRLIIAIQKMTGLSQAMAILAIVEHRDFGFDEVDTGHTVFQPFGGPLSVIRRSIAHRHCS